jgi:hypothetical protein
MKDGEGKRTEGNNGNGRNEMKAKRKVVIGLK